MRPALRASARADPVGSQGRGVLSMWCGCVYKNGSTPCRAFGHGWRAALSTPASAASQGTMPETACPDSLWIATMDWPRKMGRLSRKNYRIYATVTVIQNFLLAKQKICAANQ